MARVQGAPAASGNVIAHLLNHQVHAMLAGTTIKPPQLDEFLMASEAHLRSADMAALRRRESELFG